MFKALYLIVTILGDRPGGAADDAGFATAVHVKEAV